MNAISLSSAALMLGAGTLAGGVNALAGGGSLISFPALLAAGLPPVVAAASNTVAIWPGHALATVSYRHSLGDCHIPHRRLIALCLTGIIGSALGAALLRAVSDRVLSLLIPVLLGVATLTFAAGPRLAKTSTVPPSFGHVRWLPSVFIISAYGGFFGAGLGVMLMAVLLMLGVHGTHENNALKNLIATCITTASAVFVIASGLVAWLPVVIVTVGATLGGMLGGRAAQRVSPMHLRFTVIVLGCALTVVYGFKCWS
jgi:uncharacterized protein